MRKRLLVVAGVCALAAAAAGTTVISAGNEAGFDTARPPYLIAEPGSGTLIDPILSTGDIVGGYQMSGIPDGLGAYKDNHNNIVVMMNHELGRTFPALPPGVDTRISRVVINEKNRTVQSASYPFTGAEGYERFCSGTLEVLNGTPRADTIYALGGADLVRGYSERDVLYGGNEAGFGDKIKGGNAIDLLHLS